MAVAAGAARRSERGQTFTRSRKACGRAILKVLWKGGCKGATVSSRPPRRAPGGPPPASGSSASAIGNLAPEAESRRRRRVSPRNRPPGRLDRTSSVTRRETERGGERTQLVEAVDQGNFSKLKAPIVALRLTSQRWASEVCGGEI